MIVAGACLFEQLLNFLICFIKPVLVFSGRQVNNFSRCFLWYGLHLFPLFLRLCSCHTMKYFLQNDLEIAFHPWVTKCVHLQFLRMGSFPLGRRLKGKCDFAVYQPMISVAVCTGHRSGVKYVSRVMLPSQDIVQAVSYTHLTLPTKVRV